MYYTFADTPVGTLLFINDGKVITGIHWKVSKHRPKVAKGWIENRTIFKEALGQFDEYFAGKRRIFTFAYIFRGTEFQKSAWKELEKLPYGAYSSYQGIANAIGKPFVYTAVREWDSSKEVEGTRAGHTGDFGAWESSDDKDLRTR